MFFFKLFDVCTQNLNFMHTVIQFKWYDVRCISTSVNFPAERSKRYCNSFLAILICASGCGQKELFLLNGPIMSFRRSFLYLLHFFLLLDATRWLCFKVQFLLCFAPSQLILNT